ncbi:trans-aconitate 2-methyltransferase [Reyranella sp.]|uniref:class I SAM-dependent methyltransferase n=1 Tax=Reyranella sp. TaxID=1929291 RepID=UPI00120FC9C9|nr:class I SAM-dependent methyltransferase [Reyranella sp.]TAJ89267.1 MAG: class I SAM-dependent methyltransferase [Reyranella sp.]
MGSSRSHWEDVYAAKAETAVSWYQRHPVRSLQMIVAAAPDRAAPVIDIGGGASTLVDDLLAEGFGDVTVLDVAEAALAKSKARLGSAKSKVSWIVADITQWKAPRHYQVWHDRAVFHFLTDTARQDAYIAALEDATRPGATVIMATFALDGPEKCSGLPVQRYSPQTLAARLGRSFQLIDEARETHMTPGGSEQHFSYAVLRR